MIPIPSSFILSCDSFKRGFCCPAMSSSKLMEIGQNMLYQLGMPCPQLPPQGVLNGIFWFSRRTGLIVNRLRKPKQSFILTKKSPSIIYCSSPQGILGFQFIYLHLYLLEIQTNHNNDSLAFSGNSLHLDMTNPASFTVVLNNPHKETWPLSHLLALRHVKDWVPPKH